MRIISGEAGGRTLYAPDGESTRPTSDKIRGSLFNILGSRVYDANVLDLFGGTGALALEALSRGAAFAVISDHSRIAIEYIQRNAVNVLKEQQNERVRIMKADYHTAISSVRDMKFDLVFLDPPYRMTEVYADSIDRLNRQGSLAEDGIIVMERSRENSITVPDEFEIYDSRNYRDTVIDFVQRRMNE